ncbi:hypothetical protein [Sphingomonas sp. PB4P5]|uniref:hypothetical protein n=1 Tax=Parasphingomonas puruogangriensis TaxID=3096155 RepID=UPI002FCA4ED2
MSATVEIQPDVAALVARCRAKCHIYTPREVEFLGSLREKTALTNAQREWVVALAEREPIDFDGINKAALAVLDAICRRWLSEGVLYGKEWVARNPTRADGKPGSFRINVQTGRWADFAVQGAKGGDVIGLAAYLFHGGDRIAAAIDVKRMVGL